MRPLELIIPGHFYDSQIYSGYLYLWATDGSIVTVDWNQLIQSLEVDKRLQLALRSAFQRSELLYGEKFRAFLDNEEIRHVITRQFDDLSKYPIEVSLRQLERYSYKNDNPFPFPHADAAIYINKLYVAGRSGIHYLWLEEDFSSNALNQLWDGITLSVAAGSSRLAIAAGEEGTWQTYIAPEPTREVLKVHEAESSIVRWIRINLFMSSETGRSFFAEFKTIRKKGKGSTPEPDTPPKRELKGVISVDQIFDHPAHNRDKTFVWGSEDRICMLDEGVLRIAKYSPRRPSGHRFAKFGSVPLENAISNNIVGGDSAVFGFILELSDALVVLDSDMEIQRLPGEPVNWRVFPRSVYYTNQLHVIREDSMSVYSFNHDYFVDQTSKLAGTERRLQLKQ